jgi:hypothetical protein
MIRSIDSKTRKCVENFGCYEDRFEDVISLGIVTSDETLESIEHPVFYYLKLNPKSPVNENDIGFLSWTIGSELDLNPSINSKGFNISSSSPNEKFLMHNKYKAKMPKRGVITHIKIKYTKSKIAEVEYYMVPEGV